MNVKKDNYDKTEQHPEELTESVFKKSFLICRINSIS